jgi:hypothetical protein
MIAKSKNTALQNQSTQSNSPENSRMLLRDANVRERFGVNVVVECASSWADSASLSRSLFVLPAFFTLLHFPLPFSPDILGMCIFLLFYR